MERYNFSDIFDPKLQDDIDKDHVILLFMDDWPNIMVDFNGGRERIKRAVVYFRKTNQFVGRKPKWG